MDGQRQYEQAVELLSGINEQEYNTREYAGALDLIIESYRFGYKKSETLQLLYDVLYQPQETFMRQRYASNLAKLTGSYSFLFEYDKLPFLIFPLNDEKYWIFYKDTQAFKPNNWIIYCDYLIQRLILEDEPDFKWLESEFETWENQEMAYILYQEIEKELADSMVTENIEDKLAAYKLLSSDSERSDLLYGKYYFSRQEYVLAKRAAEQGLKKRRLNFELNILMGDLNMAEHDYITAIYYYLLMSKVGRSRQAVDLRPRFRQCVQQAMNRGEEYCRKFQAVCDISMAKPNLYPFVPKVSFNEEYNVQVGTSQLYEEILEYGTGEEFYCNLYNDRYSFGVFDLNKEALLRYLSKDLNIGSAFQFYVYRLIQGERTQEYTAKHDNEIVPVSTMERGQVLEFIKDKDIDSISVGRQEMQYFKLRNSMKIRSDNDFIVGKPINTSHSPQRKRLVVNILVDALSFDFIKENKYRNIPNIMKFFSKGVIFDNNYTPAEWTYPSFTAVQTGMRTDRTQIFHAQAMCKLSPEYKTIAEYLSENGYLCINTMDGVDQVFNGSCRGFSDSYHGYLNKAFESVERTIQYIDAFKNNDLYINLHFDDVHLVYGKDYQLNVKAQTDVYADERCRMNNEKSVRATANSVHTANYETSLASVDRILGNFFDYIDKQYKENEYIICLYSDHGVPIFANHIFTLSPSVSSTALMMRGGGVPEAGIVRDEVTVTTDIMAILAELLDFKYDDKFTDTILPRIFGGSGREYVVSQSIYPGQPYRMAINTLAHEFFVQSLEEVTYDGRVNANRLFCECYKKDKYHTHCTDEHILQKFLQIYKQTMCFLNDADFEKIYAKG